MRGEVERETEMHGGSRGSAADARGSAGQSAAAVFQPQPGAQGPKAGLDRRFRNLRGTSSLRSLTWPDVCCHAAFSSIGTRRVRIRLIHICILRRPSFLPLLLIQPKCLFGMEQASCGLCVTVSSTSWQYTSMPKTLHLS
jgi:hypothetical protein